MSLGKKPVRIIEYQEGTWCETISTVIQVQDGIITGVILPHFDSPLKMAGNSGFENDNNRAKKLLGTRYGFEDVDVNNLDVDLHNHDYSNDYAVDFYDVEYYKKRMLTAI